MNQKIGPPSFFNDDYLYFTDYSFTHEMNQREAELIWRLLEIETGMHILDLGCGTGRIANILAQMGGTVSGLDNNRSFIKIAQNRARQLRDNPTYEYGDLRSLPWEDKFDRIIIWFSTFGYFTDMENRSVLNEVYKCLKPGGRLLIDQMNRDGMLHILPRDFLFEREHNLQIIRNSYDILSGRLMGERITIRDGVFNRTLYTVRLLTFTELRDWLVDAGFSQILAFGSDGNPFSIQSDRMIVIAHKITSR